MNARNKLCFCLFFLLPFNLCKANELAGVNFLTKDGKSSLIESPRGISSAGDIAFTREVSPTAKQLISINPKTMAETRVDSPGAFYGPMWSPDGKTLAYDWAEPALVGDKHALHLWNKDTNTIKVLGEGPGAYGQCVWSPDGKYVATRKYSLKTHFTNLVIFNVATENGVEVDPTHIDSGTYQSAGSWSPDSKHFAYPSQLTVDGKYSLWTCNADGTRLKRLTPPGCEIDKVCWLNNGKWIVFGAHYQRDTDPSWMKDIWMIRPTGERLHKITSGASTDTQKSSSYGLYNCTPDDRYAISRWYFPDAFRTKSNFARGWAYVDLKTGDVIPAVATDISSKMRDTGGPHYEMSPDGSRFYCVWAESEINNLKTADETYGATYEIAQVFDVKTRTRKEILRFPTKSSPYRLLGWWPYYSPDGRQVYFTLRKEVAGAVESYVCYVDIDKAL